MPVIMTEEEARLPYAKYFTRPMAAIPQEKLDIWHGEPADPALATPIEKRDDFLKEDAIVLENGFTVAENGTGLVANVTFMPGVTSEMMDWWFAWHCIGPDLRYKIWDPDDHYHARALTPDYVRDPNVPMNQKTWSVNHDILEDIGFGPEDILLCFKRPADLGYDEGKLGTAGCSSMVCAAGKGSLPAIMTHKWVEEDGGIWFKSHFWLGYGVDDDGNLVKVVPDGVSTPVDGPRALYGHNIKEYSNLAAILPEIYAEEGSKPL